MFISDKFWRDAQRRGGVHRERKIRREGAEGVERWMGTGFSSEEKSYLAGVQAAREAVDKLGGKEPSFGLVFVSGDYDYKVLLDGIKSTLEVPVMGAEAPGGFFTEDMVAQKGVVVAVFSAEGFDFSLGMGGGFISNSEDAISKACEEVKRALPEKKWRALFLFIPNSIPMVGEVSYAALREIAQDFSFVLGGILGFLGDPKFLTVFWEGETYSDHVLALGIASDSPMSLSFAHGFHPICPFKLTSVKGNFIKELDGQPVERVLTEIMKKRGVDVDRLSDPVYAAEILPRFQLAVAHPERPGQFRAFLGLSLERGGLRTNALLEEGVTVWLMEANSETMDEATEQAVRRALMGTKGHSLVGGLVFESAVRVHLLGERHGEEVERLSRDLGVPLLGLATVEEVIISPGVFSGSHTGTLAVSLLTREGP